MNKDRLIDLIDQVTEIKKRFKTYYRTVAACIDKPPKKLPYQSVRNDGEFLFWKDQLMLHPASNQTFSTVYFAICRVSSVNDVTASSPSSALHADKIFGTESLITGRMKH